MIYLYAFFLLGFLFTGKPTSIKSKFTSSLSGSLIILADIPSFFTRTFFTRAFLTFTLICLLISVVSCNL